MATKNIPARIQHPVYSAAALEAANPVLLEGEIVYESDTRKHKVGNGTTAWNDLPYEGTEGVPGAIPAENIVQNPTHRFVTDAEKESVSEQKAMLDNLQPVGENLLRHTKDFTQGWIGKGEMASETFDGLIVYHAKGTGDMTDIRQQNVPLLPSTEYTLSFWAKGTGTIQSYCYPSVNDRIIATNGHNIGYTGRDTFNSYDLTSEWKRYWTTFRTYDEASGGAVLFRVMAENEAYVCGAKLAQGNKGTVWTESPEDIEYGAANIIDDTQSRTIGAGDNNYAQAEFAVGAVAVGDQFALSVGSIDLLAGTATEFTAQLYDYTANVPVSTRANLTADNRAAVDTVWRAAVKAFLIVYAGTWGSTAGNTVRYEKVMLVRGNRPATTWTPSIADLRRPATTSAAGLLSAADKLKLDRCFPACGISDSGSIEVSGGVKLSQLLRYESEFGMWTTRIVAATSSSVSVYDDITDKTDKPVALDVLIIKDNKTSELKIQCSFFLRSTTITVEKEYNYLVLHFVRGGEYYNCTGINKLSY